jgi:hypothetical protein
MRKVVVLNPDEIRELERQGPEGAGMGGFQNLSARLQNKLDLATQELVLDDQDLDEIPRYAFDYQNVGWETQLMVIFAQSLGPTLGR